MENLTVNTLVTHKKLKTLGIGCISKVSSSKVKVNFGREDAVTCNPNLLDTVDTSQCKTIPFKEFSRRILNDNSTLNYCIVGNELKHFVGIGWLTERVVTPGDLKKYPRVI